MANKSNITPHAVSTAMDARLETGVQLAAELRLKVRSIRISSEHGKPVKIQTLRPSMQSLTTRKWSKCIEFVLV